MSCALKLDRCGRLVVPERSVQSAVVELLEAEHWLPFVTHEHEAFKSEGRSGQPDVVAVKDEAGRKRVLLIECKRRDGQVSKAQRAWHAEAERRGFRVLVIREVNELKAFLR